MIVIVLLSYNASHVCHCSSDEYRYGKLTDSFKLVKIEQTERVSSGGVRNEQALVLGRISTMFVMGSGLDPGRLV